MERIDQLNIKQNLLIRKRELIISKGDLMSLLSSIPETHTYLNQKALIDIDIVDNELKIVNEKLDVIDFDISLSHLKG